MLDWLRRQPLIAQVLWMCLAMEFAKAVLWGDLVKPLIFPTP